ncbi:16082_t:CDS:2, partial [Dentiscutata heterogama]
NPKTNTIKKSKTIPGISKWLKWSWPITGEFARYVRACSLSNIGVWNNFQPAQIAPFCKRLSPTFSKSSTPKAVWIVPTPKLLTSKKTNKELLSVNDELAEMLNTARDCYSPEDMHPDFENLVKNGELSFEKIPTVKTIKGWIRRYNASFKKEVSERALTEANNDDHISIYNKSSKHQKI